MVFEQVPHRFILPHSDLERKQAAGREPRGGFGDERTDHIKAIGPGEQGAGVFVQADDGIEPGPRRILDVGRV